MSASRMPLSVLSTTTRKAEMSPPDAIDHFTQLGAVTLQAARTWAEVHGIGERVHAKLAGADWIPSALGVADARLRAVQDEFFGSGMRKAVVYDDVAAKLLNADTWLTEARAHFEKAEAEFEAHRGDR